VSSLILTIFAMVIEEVRTMFVLPWFFETGCCFCRWQPWNISMVGKAPTLVSYDFVTGWVKPNYADDGIYVIAHKAWKFLKNCARCVLYVSIIFLKFMKLQFSGPYPHPCISPDEIWLVGADLWSHARFHVIAATCPLHGEKPKITLCVNEILAVCHMATGQSCC